MHSVIHEIYNIIFFISILYIRIIMDSRHIYSKKYGYVTPQEHELVTRGMVNNDEEYNDMIAYYNKHLPRTHPISSLYDIDSSLELFDLGRIYEKQLYILSEKELNRLSRENYAAVKRHIESVLPLVPVFLQQPQQHGQVSRNGGDDVGGRITDTEGHLGDGRAQAQVVKQGHENGRSDQPLCQSAGDENVEHGAHQREQEQHRDHADIDRPEHVGADPASALETRGHDFPATQGRGALRSGQAVP